MSLPRCVVKSITLLMTFCLKLGMTGMTVSLTGMTNTRGILTSNTGIFTGTTGIRGMTGTGYGPKPKEVSIVVGSMTSLILGINCC